MPEAEQLRRQCLARLEAALAELNAAGVALCNVQGEGYADAWTAIDEPIHATRRIHERIRHLPAPTGVWKP